MDCRKEFAEFDDTIYLNTAGQGALPLASARAAQQAITWKKLPHQSPENLYYELPDRIRASIAKIIGANAEDIAITTGASYGMFAVAAGIDWQPGDEVLVGRGEFPAHFSAWVPYEQAGKLRMKVVAPRNRFITAEDYIDQIGPRTRLVSASLVRFDDGVRLDAKKIADACHAAGAFLLLDVSQCCGAQPMDVASLGADFIVGAGYKWLLSPYGTGFFWTSRKAGERLVTGPLYWLGLEGAREFHGLPTATSRAVPGARRWDSPETGNFINLAAMDVSIQLVLQIGVEKIAEYIGQLVSRVIDGLPRDRCVLASPPECARRGPYVCLAARNAETTHALYDRLGKEKIIVSLREGALRIAPYIFNTEHDIDRLIRVLSV